MGRFSFYGDFIWARIGIFGGALRSTNPVGLSTLSIGADTNFQIKPLIIGETWMGYEFARWRQGGSSDAFTAIDAYGGLRY